MQRNEFQAIVFKQKILREKINHYLAEVGRPLMGGKGCCHGLSLLWIQKMTEFSSSRKRKRKSESIIHAENTFKI